MKKDLLFKMLIFTFLGILIYIILSSLFYNISLIFFIVYYIIFVIFEVVYLAKKKKVKIFSKKGSSILLAVLIKLLFIFVIFGLIDYVRTTRGNALIFTYLKVSVVSSTININGKDSANPPDRTGITYEGLGYKIEVCDVTKEEYHFQVGFKDPYKCYKYLNCSKTIAENDKQNIEYTFFDGKLESIGTYSLIPANQIKNLKKYEEELNKINSIYGCSSNILKINDTTYETLEQCFIPNMLELDIQSHYKLSKEKLEGQSKEDIINSYDNKDYNCE